MTDAKLPTAEEREPILRAIPHRPPFLFLDRIVERTNESIRCEYLVRDDDVFVEGHYPGNPLMPGMLQCEALLQAGAVMMAYIDSSDATGRDGFGDAVPVLTRLKDAKFRRAVRPGELLELAVSITERVGEAVEFRGIATVAGKKSVVATFITALVPSDRLDA